MILNERLQQRLNNDNNDLQQVPFDVHNNDWQKLRIMLTVVIVANRYFKLSANQALRAMQNP